MSRLTRNTKPQRARPAIEPLEDRAVPAGFRSFDGTGNNADHPEWGSTGEALLRKGPIRYADGISEPAPQGGVGRPSARVISNTIVDQGDADIISDRQLSAMIYAWGQFIDHDMDLTTNASPAEPFNIPVPTGDPFFDPNSTGTQVIFFNRSEHVPGTGTDTSNPRQQPNDITAFLDASMVYGSSDAVADALRTFSGGRLKTSPGPDGRIGTQDDFLPFNSTDYFTTDELAALHIVNDAHRFPDDTMFAAGDIRVNENIELSSLHTLFVREHNRIANAIRSANPLFSDETIYQLARRQVGAEIQSITYNEWLPALLGPNPLPAYTGYKPGVNAGIMNEFSTALFRVGHSMLGNDVEFLDNQGLPVADEIPLSEAFFNPPGLQANGISPILKYLASDPSSEIDNTIVGSVRNFLFGPPGAGGFDLSSLNIQRGRDHGLANYNAVRVAYGLPAVTAFDQISSNPEVQQKLQDLYQNVNNIDLWVGALAEDHVPGTSTGRLIRAGLIDQFTRLRDGDSFWFQRIYSAADQATLRNDRSLADLIRLDTAADVIQNNIFFIRTSISGEVFNDTDRDGRHDSTEPGLAGRTVKLFNTTEEVPVLLATAVTNANGRYRFDYFDGLLVGNYQVVEEVPAGWVATSANPRDVNIPRGETFLDVDFGNVRVTRSAAGAAATTTSGGTKGSTTTTPPSDPTVSAPVSATLTAPSGTTATPTGSTALPTAPAPANVSTDTAPRPIDDAAVTPGVTVTPTQLPGLARLTALTSDPLGINPFVI
jgi:peroxidase